MARPVQSWNFGFRDGVDPGALLLSNGDRVPLPPRKMWLGGAKVTATPMDDDGQKSNYVTLTYDEWNQDEHKHLVQWVTGMTPGKLAEAGAMRIGLTIGGSLVGGVLRGLTSVLIPSPIAKDSHWRTEMADGVPVTCIMIG